jgi:hypothetical protein
MSGRRQLKRIDEEDEYALKVQLFKHHVLKLTYSTKFHISTKH